RRRHHAPRGQRRGAAPRGRPGAVPGEDERPEPHGERDPRPSAGRSLIDQTKPATELRELDDYRAVDHANRVRLDGLRRRERDRLAGRELEHRAVPWADDAAAILVPVALAERAVVVRAAVLDRVQLAAAVVDADEEAS